MIPVEQAKSLIRERVSALSPVEQPLAEAAGLKLAENVYAPLSIPAYAQSSMDGYAFAFEQMGAVMEVHGEQAAGDGLQQLQAGTAMRIFTGAALPEGADTIIIQEKVRVEGGRIHLDPAQVKRGDHVRGEGSEIRKGELALQKGSVLTPTAIGFMAAIGVARVTVIPRPKITIIVTGNELLKPGDTMQPGKVFEASSFALRAALVKAGCTPVAIDFVKDDPDHMSEVLWLALADSDMVLMTGGVSVGDHDHTAETAGRCGVERIFHRVRQKPGKPLYFGMQGSKVFFGLPGNPSSVLTCFYEYVLTALKQMTGLELEPVSVRAKLAGDQSKAKGLTQFLKADYGKGVVTVLGAQESYKLNSFARANALLVFPEDQEYLKVDSEVEVHLLP